MKRFERFQKMAKEEFGVEVVSSEDTKYSSFESLYEGTIFIPKIINGSKMKIGGKDHFYTEWKVEQHFNWFQKLFWKWCFGIIVEDYSEE